MKRSLKLCLVMILVLSLFPLAACTDDGKTSSPPAPSNSNPPENSTDKPGDDEVREPTFYWSLEAAVTQTVDIGTLGGLPGIYFTYVYDITMSGTSDIEGTSSIPGDYVIQVESRITMESDEAAGTIASLILGEEISGSGLGISGSYHALYLSKEPVYIQRLSPNWKGIIKDMSGRRVYPPPGSYLLFEELTLEYTGASAHLSYGNLEQMFDYPIYLYLVISPNGNLETGEHAVTVYITFPGMVDDGAELWLTGDGTMTVKMD